MAALVVPLAPAQAIAPPAEVPARTADARVFSLEGMLGDLARSRSGLAAAIDEAAEQAALAREARAAATRTSVAASAAAVLAESAARTARAAVIAAEQAQAAVDRWGAAAYRQESLGLLAASVVSDASPSDALHLSGLSEHAGEYQAYLIERARQAATASQAAVQDAQISQAAAQRALASALAQVREAELAEVDALAAVDAAERKLRSARGAFANLLPGLTLREALGVARAWERGDYRDVLAQASLLKDMRPFAPGSGPNSNERLGEWQAWNPTVVEGTPRAFAVLRLKDFEWDLLEWPCLDRLWWHESGWDGQSSDAMQGTAHGELVPTKTWGIPQAFPASKMGDVSAGGGPDWATNPLTQVNWGLTYISRVYGSPCQAWEAWRARAATGSYGWY